MLRYLRVRNLGVLAEAVIEPSAGLTVITGETGAGKTLLLGGLRLLRGEKANPALVGPSSDRAEAEGLFDDDGEIGASRVVPGSGKSRAHLEGAVVSAGALAERIGDLVEVVGQHDQIRLTRSSEVLRLVDAAMGPGSTAKARYAEAWGALTSALERQGGLGGDEAALRRELDLARFQAGEIEGAELSEGEDRELEAQAASLRNVEATREHLAAALRALDRVVEDAGEAIAASRKAVELDPSAASLAAGAENALAHVSELRSDVRSAAEGLEPDPRRLEEVESKLTAIGELKRKYGRSVSDVLSFGREAGARSEELAGRLEAGAAAEAESAAARAKVGQAASALSSARREAVKALVAEATTHLRDLALSGAVVDIGLEPACPGPTGADRAAIAFSSSRDLKPRPLGDGASGGELSRLVLAIRLATRAPDATTLVFDEVDTGIGGATALAMGDKLAALSGPVQVLCVTHLPQVAARADAHYVIERDGGEARVRQVAGPDRVREISRMMAGRPDSDGAKMAAEELLGRAAD